MPVSEEYGVDLLGRRSSDSFVDVPIKKRKFHMFQSLTPPRMSPSPPREPEMMHNDQSIPELAKPLLRSGGTTEGCSSADGRSFANEKMNLIKESSIGLKHQCLHVACSSSSKAELANKGKFGSDERKVQQISVNSSPPEEGACRQFINEEMNEVKTLASIKSEVLAVPNSQGLLLTSDGSRGLSIEGQNSQGGPEKEKLRDISGLLVDSCLHINHSKLTGPVLSEEQSISESDWPKSDVDSIALQENRSYWDLNTTMDTWEGSASDLSLNHSTDKIKLLEAPQIFGNDTKPLLRSENMIRKLEENQSSSTKCVDVDNKDRTKSFDFLSCFNQDAASSINSIVKGDGSGEVMLKKPTFGDMKPIERKHVKSEQIECSAQSRNDMESCNQLTLMRTPKTENTGIFGPKVLQAGASNETRSVNPVRIKSEPIESSQVGLQSGEGTSKFQDIHNKEHPISGEAAVEVGETVAKESNVVLKPEVDASKSVGADSMSDSSQVACSDVSDPLCSVSVPTEALQIDSSVINGDEEMVNISGDIHEDDVYDSEYELDSSPNVDIEAKHRNNNDDDFEDGEVREPLVHDTFVEGVGEGVPAGHGDLDKEVDGSDPGVTGIMISAQVKSIDSKIEIGGEIAATPCTDGNDCNPCDDREEQSSSAAPSLRKTSVSVFSCKKRSIRFNHRIRTEIVGETAATPCTDGNDCNPCDVREEQSNSAAPCLRKTSVSVLSGKKRSIRLNHGIRGSMGHKEPAVKMNSNSDKVVAMSSSCDMVKDVSEDKTSVKKENAVGSIIRGEASNPSLPNADLSAKTDEAARINRRRIIGLAQGSKGPSLVKMRSIRGVPVTLRTEGKRIPHASFRVVELHARGSRDQSGLDGHQKFERERNMNRVADNSGVDFMHVKRRVENSPGALHCVRDSDCAFSSRHYNNSGRARFPRPNKLDAVVTTELKCTDHVISPDGAIVKPGKPWRKEAHEGLESFRHLPMRRRSPGGRGHVPLNVRMVHGRVISPDRCFNRGDPDMIIMRPEKFVRDLPDDMMDPLMSRSHLRYQQVHDPFIRRERSFSPVQRHGSGRIPRGCSKSPPRSRVRSPSRPSLPRRSPEQFEGHPELLIHRSPPIFRGESIRSPHLRPCFVDGMMIRRHGSPPHISQLSHEMSKVGPWREPDQPRRFILNRSPSGRILHRSTRRADVIDSEEMVKDNEHFVHAGRLDEFVVDDCDPDRQKFCERRGPIRSFRPREMGLNVDRFLYHEDGSRPYGLCSGPDADFHERGNPRDFEARVNNRLGQPRRPRSAEDQEDDGRFCRQEWGEASYNNTVRLKRGRFLL